MVQFDFLSNYDFPTTFGFSHVFQEGDAKGHHKVDDLTPFHYQSNLQCDGI